MHATLAVTVKPGAHAASVALRNGMVEIKVKEPAREQRATEAARKLLAKIFAVPPSSVHLVRGAASRVKVFRFDTLDSTDIAARLARINP